MINPVERWGFATDAFVNVGSQIAPAAGTVIADSGALPAGLYFVRALGTYGGTVDVLNNMKLFVGDRPKTILPVQVVVNSTGIWLYLDAVRVLEGQHITIQNITAGAAGSVFVAAVVATPVASLGG